VIESNRPPAYRPLSSDNNALISVEDIVIKYAPELPPVLHGVSFTLKAGLLGRTGGHFIYLFVGTKFANRKWKIYIGNEHSPICEMILSLVIGY
jgi:hypothetical protein